MTNAASRSVRQVVSRCGIAAVASVLLFCGAAPAGAQSGRKIPPRRTETPAPATPEPAPAPAPAPEPAAPKVHLSVTKWVSSIDIPTAPVSELVHACVESLANSGSCEVTPGKDLNRKQVTDEAKAATETLFLWMLFSIDAADENRATVGPYRGGTLVVTYYLFEPGTAKVRTQGRLYFDAYRSTVAGGAPLPYPGGHRGSTGYSPQEAGQRAAEYVLDALAGRSSNAPSVHF